MKAATCIIAKGRFSKLLRILTKLALCQLWFNTLDISNSLALLNIIKGIFTRSLLLIRLQATVLSLIVVTDRHMHTTATVLDWL